MCEPSLQLSHHGGRLCRQLRRPLPVPPAGPVPSTPQPAACTFFARPASLCCLCVVLAPFPQSQSNCCAPFFPRSPVASLHSIRKQHCIHLACFLPSRYSLVFCCYALLLCSAACACLPPPSQTSLHAARSIRGIAHSPLILPGAPGRPGRARCLLPSHPLLICPSLQVAHVQMPLPIPPL